MSRWKTGSFWMWLGFGGAITLTAGCLVLAAFTGNASVARLGLVAAATSVVMGVVLEVAA